MISGPIPRTVTGRIYPPQEVRVVHGLIKDENGQRVCPRCLVVCPEGKAERYTGDGLKTVGFEMFCTNPEKAAAKSNRQEIRQNKYPRLYLTCDQHSAYLVMSE